MAKYYKVLTEVFEDLSNSEIATKQRAYMRGQFDFFGLKQAERRTVFSEFIKDNELPPYSDLFEHVKWLYAHPQREYHYCAIELAMKYRKEWNSDFMSTMEFLITTNSWWDTVDYIATKLTGVFVLKRLDKQDELISPWILSTNLWLNRVAIIHQLNYKKYTNTSFLAKAILPHTHSKEFFHQKAIGWALRQYTRTDADWVIQFVEEHELKPLSKREALRLL
ncbi:MAG: DNA alkylation repair protein [Flavobacteriales bacterium]|nr:DNA alkylation repair protein [Flavobacteriales bacterium]